MAAVAGEGVGQRGSSPPMLGLRSFPPICSSTADRLPRSPSPAPPSVLSAAFARTRATKHADENQLFIAAAVKRLFC